MIRQSWCRALHCVNRQQPRRLHWSFYGRGRQRLNGTANHQPSRSYGRCLRSPTRPRGHVVVDQRRGCDRSMWSSCWASRPPLPRLYCDHVDQILPAIRPPNGSPNASSEAADPLPCCVCTLQAMVRILAQLPIVLSQVKGPSGDSMGCVVWDRSSSRWIRCDG